MEGDRVMRGGGIVGERGQGSLSARGVRPASRLFGAGHAAGRDMGQPR